MNRGVHIAIHTAGAFAFFLGFGHFVMGQSVADSVPLAVALAGVAAFIAWRQTQR